MFSGIVETTGIMSNIIEDAGCKQFTITPLNAFRDLTIGESIAVNGVCLTITSFTKQSFNVTAVPETLMVTNLDHLMINDIVNLERSLTFSSRIGGHLMQGHVDALGEIIEINAHHESAAQIVKIQFPAQLDNFLIAKGFIAIDGMSITIINVIDNCFTITLIPHTQSVTRAKYYRPGTRVNLEVDMTGKYIAKMLRGHLHANSN